MGFLSWIHRQIASEEHFQSRLKKYGWLHNLFQFSLVNSSYNSITSLFMYYLKLIFIMLVLCFHLFCYTKTALNAYSFGRADMTVANVHSIILAVFIVSVLTSYAIDKTKIKDIEELYLESLSKYETEYPETKTLFQIIMSFAGKMGIASGGMGLFVSVYLMAPLMDFRFWKENCVVEGINFCLALPHYYPYNSEEGWAFHLTELFQLVFGVYRISVFCSVQITLTIWSLHLIFELSQLKTSIEHLEDRIKMRYFKKTKRNLNDINLITLSTDETFNDCAKFCINENISHHHNILRYHERIDSIMALPSFLAYTTGTLTMAVAMIKLLSVETPGDGLPSSYGFIHVFIKCLLTPNSLNNFRTMVFTSDNGYSKSAYDSFTTLSTQGRIFNNVPLQGDTTMGGNLAYVTVLGAEIGFMVLISVMGEAVTMMAEEIFQEVSHIPIENYDLQFRRNVIIFMEGTIKPIALSSSKFNKCNMEALGNVLNAAYSFYNVTQASANLDK